MWMRTTMYRMSPRTGCTLNMRMTLRILAFEAITVTGDVLSNIGFHRNLDEPSVMVGVGIWDYLIEPVKNLHTALNEKGIEHAYVQVPAAHDWKAWHLLYAAFVEDYLWKKEDKKKNKKKAKEK